MSPRSAIRAVLVLLLALGAPALAECAPGEDPRGSLAAAFSLLEPDLYPSGSLHLPAEAERLIRTLGTAGEAARPPTDEEGSAAAALADLYGTPWPQADLDAGPASEAAATAAWLADVGSSFTTQAILATAAGDPDRVTFAAVHWPSPLAPRLRVVRIPDGERGPGNRDEILERLATCAVPVDEWVSAPEPVAVRFLDEHVHAAMLVIARDPVSGDPVERWIEPENLIHALRFEDPRTAELDSFSAWFAGEAPAVVPVTRLLPHLRSSLGPRDLWALYRSLTR